MTQDFLILNQRTYELKKREISNVRIEDNKTRLCSKSKLQESEIEDYIKKSENFNIHSPIPGLPEEIQVLDCSTIIVHA